MIEDDVAGDASVTSALGGMLEVLPKGGSKQAGIEVVLETLDVQRSEVMALGDAENDLLMLKMAGVRCWTAAPIDPRGPSAVYSGSSFDSGHMHAGVCGNGECLRGGEASCKLCCTNQR